MTFSVFIVLNFAYSVSVSLPFNMIHLTLSHSNFVLKILFFSQLSIKLLKCFNCEHTMNDHPLICSTWRVGQFVHLVHSTP